MFELTDKTKIKIDRRTLQKIFPDNESLRKFEELLRNLNDLIPEDLENLYSIIEDIGNDNISLNSKLSSRLNNAIIQIMAIQKAQEYLEKKPYFRTNAKPKLDYIDFNLNPNLAQKQGRICWNSDDITLNLFLNDSVTLQIGQETLYLIKNVSGATISNGKLVSYAGTIGASAKLKATLGIGTDEPNAILGIATQDILDNDFGFVTHFGVVRGLNTSSWSDGDLLYPSSTIAGNLTNVQPQSPNFRSPIASVLNSGSGGSGSIFVRMKTGEKISTLHDVQIDSLSNDDILQYNSTLSRWENKPLATTGVSGMFLSADGKTITVLNGLITNIS